MNGTRLMIGIVIFFTLALLLARSCENESKNKIESKQRIIGKENVRYKGIKYQIIEVDGREYITTNQGGIYPIYPINFKSR